MSANDAVGDAEPAPRSAWGTGRSGLVMALVVLTFGIYLTVGIVTMTVPKGAEAPGPKFFPSILAAACYVLAILLVAHYVQHREPPSDTDGVEVIATDERHTTFTDWRALGLTVGGFLAFALLINPVGWILSAALMFWVIAFAMGSRTYLLDAGVALVLACGIQVAFSAGLGLHLPAGILEGVL